MKEIYYLIVSLDSCSLDSCYSYDHNCVRPLSLNLYFKLYCLITDFVNNFMKIIIDTFNSTNK